MAFAPVSFSPSPLISGMAEGLTGSLDGLRAALTAGVGTLGAIGLPGSGNFGLGELLQAIRGQASESLTAPARFLALTPFQHTIGTRKGEYGYLTPEQCLQTLAGRFTDAVAISGTATKSEASPQSGQDGQDAEATRALLLLIIAAPTHAALGTALQGFNNVYPIAELEKICRRAKALSSLETDKFVIPAAPGFPAWGTAAPQKDLKGQAVAKALGGMLAAGEGLARSAAAPLDLLAGFAQKHVAKLLQKAEELAALAQSMTGGLDAWTGAYLEGDSATLFRELHKLAPPLDAAHKCTALLCWYGKPAEVAYYRESFGLCPS